METQQQAGADAESSALAQLRALVPRHPLLYSHALQIAERQANLLLRLAHAKEPPVPSEIISSLPRIEVILDRGSPVAGSAHWDGRDWLLIVNSRKHEPTRRFSLAHEFKHVIDHSTRGFLYTGMPQMTAAEQGEGAADYFASCLLMPTAWLQRASTSGCRTTAEFARRFNVPHRVAATRLTQLGLAPEQTRQLPLPLDTINQQASLDHDAPIGAEA